MKELWDIYKRVHIYFSIMANCLKDTWINALWYQNKNYNSNLIIPKKMIWDFEYSKKGM